MKTRTTIECAVDSIHFSYAIGDDWFDVPDDASYTDAGKALTCNAKLVKAISDSFELLRDTLRDDLVTIWERLDRLESK